MKDSTQNPVDEQCYVQESSTQLRRQFLSFNTDFDCADSDNTTEYFSDQGQEISHTCPLNTNDKTTYKLQSFESTFLKKISWNVIPSASNNESYQVPNLREDFQFVNHFASIDSNVQNSIESSDNYSELIDVSYYIEPAERIEFSKVSQQKESPVNVSSTLKLEEEVETKERRFFTKSGIAIENSSSDVLELEVQSVSRTRENICSECGNAFTPKSKMDQHNVVLASCICNSHNTPLISPYKKMLTHKNDVISVASRFHSRPFIINKKQKCLTKKCNLQRNKLIHKRNKCTNNAPEVLISSGTQHHKHADLVHKSSVKRHSRAKTSFITTTAMPENITREDLAPKVTSSSELKGHICLESRKVFISKSKLKRHSVVYTGEKPFLCNICHKSYDQKYNLNKHRRIKHPETFQMTIENYSFKLSRNMARNSCLGALKSEVASSSKMRGHICQESGKDFLSKLKRHSVVNTGAKPLICGICQNSYSQNCELNTHNNIHHPETFPMPTANSSKKTPADVPGNFSREYLESEVSSDSEIKGHICKECGKDFTFKSRLKIHSIVHTGEKLFVCDIGKRSYKHKASLKDHKMIHHPETFQMPRANSNVRTARDMPGNSSREDLVFEVAFSSKFKRHICQECGKPFGNKSRLKQHSVVHTGEKPFVCDICQKAYSQKGHLNEHKNIQHPETFQM